MPTRPAPGCMLVVVTLGLTMAASGLLATAILSDYWEHVTFDPEQVAAIAAHTNVTEVDRIVDGLVARLLIRREPPKNTGSVPWSRRVARSSRVVLLVPLYGGIWRLCTDLEESQREKLEALDYPYPRCISYLSTNLIQDEKNDWMTRMQNLAISCAIVCLILLGSSAFVGVFGIGKHQISAVLVTGVMYILAAVFCMFTLSIMHFKRRSGRECGAIDRQLIPPEFQAAQLLAAGWSYSLGWGGVGVCLLASFFWYLLSKIMRYGPLTII